MRLALILACLTLPATVHADACRDEIAAMFSGGTLDPFARGAHRQVKEVFGPDGTPQYTFDQIVETPLRQKSGLRGSGQFMLTIGNDTWMGLSLDGPWTPGAQMQGDIEAMQRSVPEDMAKNLSDVSCDGEVEFGGRKLIRYTYRSKVDPRPERNSWWGSLDTVYLDPETGRVVRWEQREHVSSWADGVKEELHVSTITYDDTIRVTPE